MPLDKITEYIEGVKSKKEDREIADKIRETVNDISQSELKDYMYLEKMESGKSLILYKLILLMNKNKDLTYAITDKLGSDKEYVFFSNTLYCKCSGFYNEIIYEGNNILKREFKHQVKYNYNGIFDYKGKSDDNFFIDYIIKSGLNMKSISLLFNNENILSNDQKEKLYSGLLLKLHTYSDKQGLDYLFCDKDWFRRKPNNFYYENANNGIDVFFEYIKEVKEKEANFCYERLMRELKKKRINEFINNENISLLDYAFNIEKVPRITELKFMANYSERDKNNFKNGILTSYPMLLKSQNFNYTTYKKIFGENNVLGDFKAQNKLADILLSYCDFSTLQKSGSSHKSELVKNTKKIIETGDNLSRKLEIVFLLLNMDNVLGQNNYFRTNEALINYLKPEENIKIMAEEIINSPLFSVISRCKDQLLFFNFKDTVNILYEKERLNDNVARNNKIINKKITRI